MQLVITKTTRVPISSKVFANFFPGQSAAIQNDLTNKQEYQRGIMATEMLKSAYEVAREERLKRNQKVMMDLGLATETELLKKGTNKNSSRTKKLKKQELDEIETQKEVRTSKRLKGLNPDGEKAEEKPKQKTYEEEFIEEDLNNDTYMKAKIERLKSLHQERSTGYSNPTATYEHTWKRVKTMSDKALLNRMKQIENRVGQHCIVKMRMFAEVLALAEKNELAEQATLALERLLELIDERPDNNKTSSNRKNMDDENEEEGEEQQSNQEE